MENKCGRITSAQAMEQMLAAVMCGKRPNGVPHLITWNMGSVLGSS